jgi:hypothetical protein
MNYQATVTAARQKFCNEIEVYIDKISYTLSCDCNEEDYKLYIMLLFLIENNECSKNLKCLLEKLSISV